MGGEEGRARRLGVGYPGCRIEGKQDRWGGEKKEMKGVGQIVVGITGWGKTVA